MPRQAFSVTPPPADAGALFIAVGPDEYIAASSGPVNIRFSSNTGPINVGIDSIEEGTFVDGRCVPGRRLNGGVIPNGRIQRVKLYRYC
jgi:hypothetical protein